MSEIPEMYMMVISEMTDTSEIKINRAYYLHQHIKRLSLPKVKGQMKCQGSYGHDQFSPVLLKQLQNSHAAPLAIIINKSIEDEIVPDSLKIAKNTTIFKSKDNDEIVN